MHRFRLLAPLLAGLLAVVLLVETTDLVRCADERAGEITAHGDDSDDHAADSHGHHGPVNDEHRSEHLPDCLCHVVFVPTVAPPTLGAPIEVAFAYPLYLSSVTESDLASPGHVPIG